MNNTIAAQWNMFRIFLNPMASELQIRDIRRAFYAGCSSLIQMQERTMLDENLSDEDTSKMFENWRYECAEFGKKVIENKD